MARHGCDLALPIGDGFPWMTLLINLSGSTALALLPAWSRVRQHHWAPAFLGTGVLGGFTTMSAFAEQTRVLWTSGRFGLAATYVAASTLGALALVAVATSYVERVVGRAAAMEFEAEEGQE